MRIFISPLDWGLGHAARCVPIIRYLLEKKIEIVVGAEGNHLIFLKEHFPSIEYVEFPGYRITYSATLPVRVKVLLQIPKMASAINQEYKLLHELIETKKIDAVISDNRYGLWSKKIPSVIITHQLNIQAPAGNTFLSKTASNYIKHFDECWIPDYAGEENLSGILSHPIPKGINGKYIEPLSRFESNSQKNEIVILSRAKNLNKTKMFRSAQHDKSGVKYDLLAIISGPEPQRSKLEELILKQLKELPSIKALIVQGLPGGKLKDSDLKSVEIIPHLADDEFQDAVNSSEIILCRGGYSTLMDLNAIGSPNGSLREKKLILIPTPGQTEQEYLGKIIQEKGIGVTFRQKGFSLKEAMEKAKQVNPVQQHYGKDNYKGVIDEWLKKIS